MIPKGYTFMQNIRLMHTQLWPTLSSDLSDSLSCGFVCYWVRLSPGMTPPASISKPLARGRTWKKVGVCGQF